jgi:hypothetical protein
MSCETSENGMNFVSTFLNFVVTLPEGFEDYTNTLLWKEM